MDQVTSVDRQARARLHLSHRGVLSPDVAVHPDGSLRLCSFVSRDGAATYSLCLEHGSVGWYVAGTATGDHSVNYSVGDASGSAAASERAGHDSNGDDEDFFE